MENTFLHDHQKIVKFLKDLLKGFSKRFLFTSLKMEKQMQGGQSGEQWRIVIFFEDK